MNRLNQIVAIEKGVKSKTNSTITEIHKLCQKPALFNGFSKEYSPKSEDDDIFPPEATLVQMDCDEAIKRATASWQDLFDITASKDFGNTKAVTDIEIDGKVIATGVPATFLLFLEKQLIDVRTFITKMPILDPSKLWRKDENDQHFKTDPRQTLRTKKIVRSLVMHEGNENHPPQTQLVNEDIVAGHWNQVDFSGAIPEPRQAELLEKTDKLLRAVKIAREVANNTEIERKRIGDDLLGCIFN